jgi:ribosomal protein L11 methyltransferase
MRRIAEEDWATAWKEFFPIVPVGKSTVIVPAWKRYKTKAGEIAIRLDPGMAFGTGTHPTTKLCLTALEEVFQPTDGLDPLPLGGGRVREGVKFPSNILDVGTGSGILAIAAALGGAERVIGLDIDPVAISAARANVRLNRLGRRVRFYSSGPDAAGTWRRYAPFDLILANITARENSRLASAYVGLMAPDARLIASGILTRDAETVAVAFAQAGLQVLERQDEGEWTALISTIAPSPSGRGLG